MNVIQMKQEHATWEGVRDALKVAQRTGYEKVLADAAVGAMLIEIKDRDHQGDDAGFVQRAAQEVDIARRQAFNLMSLARHRALIEERKPESQRQALQLIADLNPKAVEKITADAPFIPRNDRDVVRANAAKRRLITILSRLLYEGPELSNTIRMAIAVCDVEERKLWAKEVRLSARALLRIARTLENAPAPGAPAVKAEAIPGGAPATRVI